MTTYLGYQTVASTALDELERQSRSGDTSLMEWVGAWVLELRENLPAGCTLRAVYNPVGHTPNATTPGVMIVETENPDDLAFISNHYRGWLDYLWVPAAAVPSTREQAGKLLAATRT